MCNGCLADVTLITVPMFISVFIPIHSVLLCIGVDSMVVQPVNQFGMKQKSTVTIEINREGEYVGVCHGFLYSECIKQHLRFISIGTGYACIDHLLRKTKYIIFASLG